MSKTDLRARPIYHHKKDSIEAHLTIVFAALAVTRWLEQRTGWSIKKLVTALRRYRTIDIQAGDQTVTAADPLPADIRTVLDRLHGRGGTALIDQSQVSDGVPVAVGVSSLCERARTIPSQVRRHKTGANSVAAQFEVGTT